jgi:hypothetical protein
VTSDKERVAALERRLAHLRERIAENGRRRGGDYDCAEAAALAWVLRIVRGERERPEQAMATHEESQR